MRIPRSKSCTTPLTISDAEAVHLFIKMTNGRSGTKAGPLVLKLRSRSFTFPRVVTTISSLGTKRLEMVTASLKYPPPLLRKSNTKPFILGFSAFRARIALVTFLPAFAVNVVRTR